MFPMLGNVMGEHFFTVVEYTVDSHQKKSTVYYDSTFINIAWPGDGGMNKHADMINSQRK